MSLVSGQSPGGKSNPNMFEVEGVKVQVLRQGSGLEAKTGDTIRVHYTGWLADGKKFDSSVDRNAPLIFTLGQKRVVQGFELGVTGMKVGEKRKLNIPSELGYGAKGFLMIPANAALIFEVELVGINQ